MSASAAVVDLLLRSALARPDADAVVFPELRRSYGELLDESTLVARGLRALGVGPGDHVGILMPNCLDFLTTFLGAGLIGAVPVPVNARFKASEISYVVDNAEVVVLVTTDLAREHTDFVALLEESLPGLGRAPDPLGLRLDGASGLRSAVLLGEGAPAGFVGREQFAELAGSVAPIEVEELRGGILAGGPAVVMYTSGTTADPKGCVLGHGALTRNAAAMRERFRLGPDDRLWDPLPLFHMGGVLPLLAVLDAGAAFLTMAHFEADAALRMLGAERVTVAYPTFPAITQALVHHPDFARSDLRRLRIVLNVAPPDVQRAVQRAFPQAVQLASYGLTEAGGVVSFTELDDTPEQRATGSGRPFRGIEVQVVDPETGLPLAPGERGEILIRGYCLFEGYYRYPEATAEAFDGEGWFHTGDLCSLDSDGRISFHGRLKDVLKVGGENVGALEVESFLSTHPAAKIVQVVGVPDERLGEVPAAFVELVPGAEASEEELIAYCRGRIASFKIPRHVRFVTEWPLSATKMQKFRLREQLLAELGLAGP